MVQMTRILAISISAALLLALGACSSNPMAAPDDVQAAPPDATHLPSGLAYKVLRAGDGDVHPQLTDTVVVNYIGWTTDGRKFDSSYDTEGGAHPASFTVGGLIKGWQEALPLMVMGEKIRVWIPAEMAYGEHPVREGAPAGELVFDIELLVIKPSG